MNFYCIKVTNFTLGFKRLSKDANVKGVAKLETFMVFDENSNQFVWNCLKFVKGMIEYISSYLNEKIEGKKFIIIVESNHRTNNKIPLT